MPLTGVAGAATARMGAAVGTRRATPLGEEALAGLKALEARRAAFLNDEKGGKGHLGDIYHAGIARSLSETLQNINCQSKVTYGI